MRRDMNEIAKTLRNQLCHDTECTFDKGCGCLEAMDKMMRAVIDQTWGEAMEDGSVPSTKLQDKIMDAVVAARDKRTP